MTMNAEHDVFPQDLFRCDVITRALASAESKFASGRTGGAQKDLQEANDYLGKVKNIRLKEELSAEFERVHRKVYGGSNI